MQRTLGQPGLNRHTMDATYSGDLARRFKFKTESALGSSQASVPLSQSDCFISSSKKKYSSQLQYDMLYFLFWLKGTLRLL